MRRPCACCSSASTPAIRSAPIGHHFAGYSNRFWKLLFDSRLVPEPIGTEDDDRLPEWGYGITNLIPRATPGIDTLRAGRVRRRASDAAPKGAAWKPRSSPSSASRSTVPSSTPGAVRIACGSQRERFEGARVFVLPNPSGRNANFSYQQMLAAFRALARAAR